ncbi:MAG: signal recognition particle protein [Ktedonobacterales bacterium]|nr:signal recognition particle protein [Ktedonobacterales bacterium]
MFESLSQRLDVIFDRLRGHGSVTESDLKEVMREVRQALLEADVNFKLVKQFVANVQEKALGADVLKGLNPAQQVISIVYDELVEMLGGADADKPKIQYAGAPPTVIMLVGLQGSGKTTTIAKLALMLRKQHQKPVMVACDMQRPAAVTQLQQLGKQLDIPVYAEAAGNKPVDIALRSLQWAKEQAATIVLIDTAGRLHVDEDLMREVKVIQERTHPQETLLVVDAMTGQDAVRVAQSFHETVALTGLIMTKMDGDARGGASLSIRSVTGVPIKFMGMGEKTDALEPFYAERLAQRILGMGDVLTLIDKAKENISEDDAMKMQQKLMTASFNLEDYLNMMRQVRKMGPMLSIIEMIPGLNKMLPPEAKEALGKDDDFKRIESIILSMTPQERRNPKIINGSRKRRIAKGFGYTEKEGEHRVEAGVFQINELLKTFREMGPMMKQMAAMQQGGKGNRRMQRLMRQMGGDPGAGLPSPGAMPKLPAPR